MIKMVVTRLVLLSLLVMAFFKLSNLIAVQASVATKLNGTTKAGNKNFYIIYFTLLMANCSAFSFPFMLPEISATNESLLIRV